VQVFDALEGLAADETNLFLSRLDSPNYGESRLAVKDRENTMSDDTIRQQEPRALPQRQRHRIYENNIKREGKGKGRQRKKNRDE